MHRVYYLVADDGTLNSVHLRGDGWIVEGLRNIATDDAMMCWGRSSCAVGLAFLDLGRLAGVIPNAGPCQTAAALPSNSIDNLLSPPLAESAYI